MLYPRYSRPPSPSLPSTFAMAVSLAITPSRPGRYSSTDSVLIHGSAQVGPGTRGGGGRTSGPARRKAGLRRPSGDVPDTTPGAPHDQPRGLTSGPSLSSLEESRA